MKAYVINSFVYQEKGGNPAGVVVLEQATLTSNEMQAIAKRLGFSETAFITKDLTDADFHVRFFTPTAEVDLCGHATLASFYMLYQLGTIGPGNWTQRTKAGVLEIQIENKREALNIVMRQAAPVVQPLTPAAQAALDQCFSQPIIGPTEIWSTGLRDVICRVQTRKALNEMTVDFNALSKLSETLDVVGTHFFTLENDEIYTRNFAPLFGIDEEAATGTSNGALIAYMHHHLFPSEVTIERQIYQGEAMGQLSLITARSTRSDGNDEIWVGGQCHWVDTLTL